MDGLQHRVLSLEDANRKLRQRLAATEGMCRKQQQMMRMQRRRGGHDGAAEGATGGPGTRAASHDADGADAHAIIGAGDGGSAVAAAAAPAAPSEARDSRPVGSGV